MQGTTTSADQLLGIYLNDHLAAAAAGLALARRCLASNRGRPLGETLERLIPDIAEDRRRLEGLIEGAGLSRSRAKEAGALLGERVARLKPNGQLRGYSPVSRLLEVEALIAGIDAKRSMWRALTEVADLHPVLARTPLEELIERASHQRDALDEHHRAASRIAFGPRG